MTEKKKPISVLLFGEPLAGSQTVLHEAIIRRNKLDFSEIRTRFAPSPTGHLHMGSLATANINYLIAKSNGGKFILRIEDTDQKRLVEGAADTIVSDLDFFGLKPDEGPGFGGVFGPYTQTDRSIMHQMVARELLDAGLIYPCFCTEDELVAARSSTENYTYDDNHAICNKLSYEAIEQNVLECKSFVIRMLPVDVGITKYPDLVMKNITINHNITHPVLIKSNGIPTYIFAAIVDDWLMGITHMYRGTDWQNQVPAHLQMWEILKRHFNIEYVPTYGHLPLILQPIQFVGDKSQKKLSKRTPGGDIQSLIEQGFTTYALRAYLLGLANSKYSDEFRKQIENLPLEDFKFEINRVKSSPARFDFELLKNMSAKVFARYSMEVKSRLLKDWVLNFITEESIDSMKTNEKNLIAVAEAAKFDSLKDPENVKLKESAEKADLNLNLYRERIALIEKLAGILDLKHLQFHLLFEILEFASKRNDYSSFSDFVFKYRPLFKRIDRSVNPKIYDKLFDTFLSQKEFVEIFKSDMKSVANLLYDGEDSVPSAYDVYVYSFKNRKHE